ITGIRPRREQRRRRTALSGLAVAALHHVQLGPGALHRMAAVGRQPFDGGDRLAHSGGCRRDAGPSRRAVQVYCARAALSNTATEFRAGKAHQVAQDPEQGHVRGSIHFALDAIDGQLHSIVSRRLDSLTVRVVRKRSAILHVSGARYSNSPVDIPRRPALARLPSGRLAPARRLPEYSCCEAARVPSCCESLPVQRLTIKARRFSFVPWHLTILLARSNYPPWQFPRLPPQWRFAIRWKRRCLSRWSGPHGWRPSD